MTFSPKRILVLYSLLTSLEEARLTIRQHVEALKYSKTPHEIVYFNAVDSAPGWLRWLNFDVVILHNTLLGYRWNKPFRLRAMKHSLSWLKNADCLKIAIPQDEYDHSVLLDEWLHDWNVRVIFSNFGDEQRRVLYPIMHDKATFYHVFTGYLDEETAQKYTSRIRPIKERPNDIIYRTMVLPYWYGSQGHLKAIIGNIVQKSAEAHGLKCDISTRAQDTIYGDKWIDFMASGKTALGCESGSSALNAKGEIMAQVRTMLKANTALTFEEVSAQLPPGWDDYHFFAISPRHFEAILTKTCQVLIEGYYDGVLEADKHYIALKRDFSNLEDVLDKLHDHDLLQRIADQAYDDIYLSGKYTYHQFALQLEDAIANHSPPSQHRTAPDSLRWRIGVSLAGPATHFELIKGRAKRKIWYLLRDQVLRRKVN